MAKKQKDSEVEHLRGENRALRKQITHLKKELARADKHNRNTEDLEDLVKEYTEKEQEEVHAPIHRCTQCGSTDTSLMDLGIRAYLVCKNCKHREKI